MVLNNQAYPKFNNVLIAAGGAGSGKGYVLSEILLFQGKTFDVDEIKKKIANSEEALTKEILTKIIYYVTKKKKDKWKSLL